MILKINSEKLKNSFMLKTLKWVN